MRRRGLADAVRSARYRAAAARRFSASRQRQFELFLRQCVTACTPEQLALRWTRNYGPAASVTKARYHLVRLGLKLPRRAVLLLPYSRLKRRRGRYTARALAAQARRWQRYWEQVMQQLTEEARGLRAAAVRAGTPLREIPCRDCGSCWPAQRPFFYLFSRVKQTRQGPRQYPSCRRCRPCEARRRRLARRQPRRLPPDSPRAP